MERMFFVTLVPHETGPPAHEMMQLLERFLRMLGTLHDFAMLQNGKVFRAKLCSTLSEEDLEDSFRGMLVEAQVQEQKEECHDCQTMAA